MMDNHRLHNYDDTELLASKRSAALSDLLETAEKKLLEGDDVNFLDTKVMLEADHKEMTMALRRQFQSIHKQITDRENHLLTSLQSMMDRENVKIEDIEREFIQLTSKFRGSIANARKLLQNTISVSLIADMKQLSLDLETNIKSMSEMCDMAGKDKGMQFQFFLSEEECKAFTSLIAKFGAFIDADQPLGRTDCAQPPKLSKNLSLPTFSLNSTQALTPDIETNSVTLQPAAVISCTEKGKKFYPCGIAVGSNNLITVSDLHNNFVKVLTGTGKVIDTIENGKGSHTLKGPCSLSVDEVNDIYILERESKAIGKYTNGSLLDLGKFKQFNDPRGILVRKEKVYVTDWGLNCIHVLTLGAYNRLTYQSAIGGNSLKQPAGIAYDSKNEKIAVCDQENHCVWLLTSEGDVINVIGGEKGDGPGKLNIPYGVAITGSGKIVVSEKGNSRISVFSPQGSHLFSFGSKGPDPGQFNQLRYICTNYNKQILVADELNQRVQIFDI
jgi:DNA-binding beta-propeller fold protein YncE